MRKFVLALAFLTSTAFTFAQTEEELKTAQSAKKDSIAAIQGREDGIQAQIDALPGWKKGAFGTIGGNLSNFSNWYTQGFPNNSAGNIGFTVNAFANLNQEKFFWRNAANVNLNWVKLDDKDDPSDDDGFREATDVFNISSH